MTDHNINSDKDTAYIQGLLDRLRATLGEEGDGDEGSNSSPSYDTPRTQTAPVIGTEEEEKETLVPPVTPEDKPLPVEEVPPAVFPAEEPKKSEEVPAHDPEEEGADPIPAETPPDTFEPLPEVDPFTPTEVTGEHPTELPVETPLVAEPAEFPRYEAKEEENIPEATESLDSVDPIPDEEPQAEETVVSEEPQPQEELEAEEDVLPEDIVSPAPQEEEIRQAEERLAAILHKQEEPVEPMPAPERSWQSRRVDTSGTAAHPVGARYRSFPVPDATVMVPIIPIVEEGDLTKVATLVDVPDTNPASSPAEETPVQTEEPSTTPVETTQNETESQLPIIEPATFVDAPEYDVIPAGHLATLPPEPPVPDAVEVEEEVVSPVSEEPATTSGSEEETTPVDDTPAPAEEPQALEELDIPDEPTAPRVKVPFGVCVKRYFKALFGAKTEKSRLSIGFPFGVATIAHAPTEEGKRVRRQEISKELLADKIRCWFALAILVLLFVWEMLPGQMNTLLSRLLLTRVSGAAILIDLQLLLILCFVGYRPILRGFAAFGKKQVLPESLTSVAVVVAVGAQVTLYLLDQIVPFTLGFLAGCLVTAAVVADYFRHGTQACAMRMYSQSDEGAYVASCNEVDSKHKMEVAPTSHPVDFASRASSRYENTTANLTTLIVAFLAAVVYFFLSYGVLGGFQSIFLDRAIWGTATVFCASIPVSLFAVHSVLFGVLSQRLSEERVGVSDEEVADTFSSVSEMIFRDTDAFPTGSVRVRGIKLRGDFRMDNALYLVSSLFRRVAAPLGQVFGLSTTGVTLSDDVEIRSIEEDGIEARINGEDLCVGSKEYLRRLGISVYNDPDDQKAIEDHNAILCVAYRTQMCAKFYIRYTISTAFEANVEYYAKHGISTVLYTADPMLTPQFVDAISYVSDSKLSVLRQGLHEVGEELSQPREGGLISVGPRKSLRRMPFFFRIYRACRATLHLTSCFAVLANAVGVPLLMLLLKSDAAMVTPLIGALFQFFWLIPSAITSLILARMNPNKQQ